MKIIVRQTVSFFIILLWALALPPSVFARIEIILMGQANGLKPPPLDGENWLRGTPFGHMALYIESATLDDEKIIRQCAEGERGGVVVTVDKQLKDRFFAAKPRNEFFYGQLDPENLPQFVTRSDIANAFARFNEKYGHLYKKGPGISGFGQDYGILYIRDAWGLVYPTTREEELKIIEYWQQRRHDKFRSMFNNCVTTVIRSLNHAGIEKRSAFIRGLAPYNAWAYFIRKLVLSGTEARAPNGNYLKRNGSFVTRYEQLNSDAVRPSQRPFNVYSLLNMEYLIWVSPQAAQPLPADEVIDYKHYPSGTERASGKSNHGFLKRRLRWLVSQPDEFIRLWPQSFRGLWFLITK